MKKLWAILLCAAMLITTLSGCGSTKEKEQGETISVYLVTNALYDQYAPYIQAQLPDGNVALIVGQNDLDFYQFNMKKHESKGASGGLAGCLFLVLKN